MKISSHFAPENDWIFNDKWVMGVKEFGVFLVDGRVETDGQGIDENKTLINITNHHVNIPNHHFIASVAIPVR
ncbi:MAG: hypothetical protein ACXVAY_01235 [Mucilaginibacter sp.]